MLGMNEDIEIKLPPKGHNFQNMALGDNLETFVPWERTGGAWQTACLLLSLCMSMRLEGRK